MPAAARTALAGALLLLLVPAAARAEEANIYLAPSAWLADLGGDGQTGGGARDEQFDLESTLGLDTGETVPSFEGFIRFGRNRFVLGLNNGGWDGGDRLKADLVVEGTTFPAGTRIRSEFDLNRRRLLYGRPFAESKALSIGFLVGLHTYDIEATVGGGGVGRERVTLDSKVPVLGANITFFPTRFVRIYGEATGLSIERGGVDSKIIDAYAVAEWTFLFENLAVSLGYRYTKLEAEEDEESRFDLTQQGVITGFVVRF